MAKITPIDVIKSISGSYGHNSNDYFATNKSSNKIRLAKLQNPYKGPWTEKQVAQHGKFKARQAVASAWLRANHPNQANGNNGTALYQQAMKIKLSLGLSSVTQVVYKYMTDDGKIELPAADETSATAPDGGTSTGGTGTGSDTNESL